MASLVLKRDKETYRVYVVELEFMNFQTPTENGYTNNGDPRDLTSFLDKNAPSSLRYLTSGIFTYSSIRPLATKTYFHQIFDKCVQFRTNLESWHTEAAPGVFEAVCCVNGVAVNHYLGS